MQLFLDLDGVLADFDRHYVAMVGPLPDRDDPKHDVSWKAIAGIDFFGTMPPMPDAFQLYEYVKKHQPMVLSGVPTTGTEQAAVAKYAWVQRHFPGMPVITTRSRDKVKYMQPGDVIVDDWNKYRQVWVDAGGIWVLHRSAAQTIAELRNMGL